MNAEVLDFTTLILGTIIGFIGYAIFNLFYNAGEYLRYGVYKKEKDFKEKKKDKKE